MFSVVKSRNFAKIVVDVTYHTVLVTASTTAIEQVAEPQTEAAKLNCEMAGFTVGSAIWLGTRRRVIAKVDKVADWRIARKAQKEEAATSE